MSVGLTLCPRYSPYAADNPGATQVFNRNLYSVYRMANRPFETRLLERLTKRPQPETAKGTVIFAGLSKMKFSGGGKIHAFEYLPTFGDLLRENGYRSVYTTSVNGLKQAIAEADYAVVVLVYKEVGFIPDDPRLSAILSKADFVLHHPETGTLISDKSATNKYLTARGIRMPEVQTEGTSTQAVFSNHNEASGADVWVVSEGTELDTERYNTSFIDTRVTFEGDDYYTSVRLMCIGAEVTHAYVRARKVSENNPSVHARDTPVNSDLINFLYDHIIVPNMPALRALAEQVADALGPGFLSHDVLVEQKTGQIYLAETGTKFDDPSFYRRMSPILRKVPSMAGFTTAREIAQNSFPAFLDFLDAQKQGPDTEATSAQG